MQVDIVYRKTGFKRLKKTINTYLKTKDSLYTQILALDTNLSSFFLKKSDAKIYIFRSVADDLSSQIDDAEIQVIIYNFFLLQFSAAKIPKPTLLTQLQREEGDMSY